jgi:hypothetical protein
MSLRPPRSHSSPSRENALDYEIAQEQAAALGRLGRALEAALAALSAYDRAQAERGELPARPGSPGAAVRARLVQDAGYALWCFIIQREVCGLRDPRPVLREYRVPAEVYNRMGVFDRGSRPSSA